MKKLNKAHYTIPGSSIVVNVLNVIPVNDQEVMAKLRFEYKNGMIID